VLLGLFAIWIITTLVNAGGTMDIKKEKLLYNKLISLEKEKNWIMLSDTIERTGAESYKKLFVLTKLNTKNKKNINIGLFTPKEWPSKNLGSYALSPNGRNIAFVISNYDFQIKKMLNALHIMSLNNHNTSTILPPREFPNIGSICWLPNGKKIIFVATFQVEEDTSTASPKLYYSLCSLDVITGNIDKLINIDQFGINSQSISPDGSEVVLSVNGKGIFIYNFEKGKLTKLADGMWPTWSPTDKIIVFYGLDENYYSINPDGTNKKLFINNEPLSKKQDMPKGGLGEYIDKIYGELLWSPDAKYIYFERAAVDSTLADTEYYIAYIMEVETKQEIRLSTSGIKSWVGQK
jgi:WD40 repeat protein